MAHGKHTKAISTVPSDASDVVRSISAGRPAEIENKIQQRAHELYAARGRESGRELEDWLRAESEVLSTSL